MSSASKFRWWMRRRYRLSKPGLGFTVLLALATLSSLVSAPARGGPLEDCYRDVESRLEVRSCLEARIVEVETQLTETERKLRNQLVELAGVTGRDSAVDALDQATKDFRVFRDSACRLVRLEAEPGTGAANFERDCYVRMTQKWVDEIRSRASVD